MTKMNFKRATVAMLTSAMLAGAFTSGMMLQKRLPNGQPGRTTGKHLAVIMKMYH